MSILIDMSNNCSRNIGGIRNPCKSCAGIHIHPIKQILYTIDSLVFNLLLNITKTVKHCKKSAANCAFTGIVFTGNYCDAVDLN